MREARGTSWHATRSAQAAGVRERRGSLISFGVCVVAALRSRRGSWTSAAGPCARSHSGLPFTFSASQEVAGAVCLSKFVFVVVWFGAVGGAPGGDRGRRSGGTDLRGAVKGGGESPVPVWHKWGREKRRKQIDLDRGTRHPAIGAGCGRRGIGYHCAVVGS
jgi:hypothetical protein